MSGTIPTPVEFMQDIAQLRLPPSIDRKLQSLMDDNNNGLLSDREREQLEGLVEWSESLSLLKARAMSLLREQVP